MTSEEFNRLFKAEWRIEPTLNREGRYDILSGAVAVVTGVPAEYAPEMVERHNAQYAKDLARKELDKTPSS